MLSDIHALGASLVAVSPQTPDNSLLTAEKNALQFEVLSDVGNTVARQFGLVFALTERLRPVYKSLGADLPAYNGDESYELPLPGTFMIAQDGTIRLAFVEANFARRLEPTEIVESLKALVHVTNRG
jgi:peroxiredoxin